MITFAQDGNCFWGPLFFCLNWIIEIFSIPIQCYFLTAMFDSWFVWRAMFSYGRSINSWYFTNFFMMFLKWGSSILEWSKSIVGVLIQPKLPYLSPLFNSFLLSFVYAESWTFLAAEATNPCQVIPCQKLLGSFFNATLKQNWVQVGLECIWIILNFE